MPEINAIIDLSHFNVNPDFDQVKADGILGVIHKATQGASFVDNMYIAHRDAARAAGLLWGAYHFGTGVDGAQQADFFLETVGADPDVLLVLDFEQNPTGPSMTLDQAREFVTRIQCVTGCFPGLYGGIFLKQLLGNDVDPVLANCWFWLAQHKIPTRSARQLADLDHVAVYGRPERTRSAQWAGIGPCDRDRFQGTEADLRQFWMPASQAGEEGREERVAISED